MVNIALKITSKNLETIKKRSKTISPFDSTKNIVVVSRNYPARSMSGVKGKCAYDVMALTPCDTNQITFVQTTHIHRQRHIAERN